MDFVASLHPTPQTWLRNSALAPPCVRLDVATKFTADDPRRSDPTCKEIGIQKNSKNRP